MTSRSEIGTEVYECYTFKWANLKLPKIGSAQKATFTMPSFGNETTGEIGILRLDEWKFTLYMFAANLHKYGIVIQQTQCVITCNWRHPFDFSGEHSSHTCPEIRLDSVDTVQHSSIQIFTGELTLNLPEKKCEECAIEMKFTADIAGIVKNFQVQKHHNPFCGDSRFTLSGHFPWTDVEVVVNGVPRKMHKFVLASRSPMMAKLLSENAPIEIEATEANVCTLFGFIYRGTLDGPVNDELLCLARHYEVRTLIEICEAAKAVDCEMDILRFDSINDELKNYADKRRKLMESYKGDYEVPAELTQRVGYIRPFPNHLLRSNPGLDRGPERTDPCLVGDVNSQLENCNYDTVIRHCSEIKFEEGQVSMRWSFTDRFNNFSFFAAIHENEDPDSYVDISLRFVQRERIQCSSKVVKVLFSIHTEPYQRAIRAKTQIGELVQCGEESQIRVWKGKAYIWNNQCDLPNWLPRIEFFIYVKGSESSGSSIRDGQLANDFLLSFEEKKWTDIDLLLGEGAEVNVGDVQHRIDDTKFAVHRYMISECSTLFARMMRDEGSNKSKTLVLAQHDLDLDGKTLKAILKFFYTGKLSVSVIDKKFLRAAEELGNIALVTLCKRALDGSKDCEALLSNIEWSL